MSAELEDVVREIETAQQEWLELAPTLRTLLPSRVHALN